MFFLRTNWPDNRFAGQTDAYWGQRFANWTFAAHGMQCATQSHTHTQQLLTFPNNFAGVFTLKPYLQMLQKPYILQRQPTDVFFDFIFVNHRAIRITHMQAHATSLPHRRSQRRGLSSLHYEQVKVLPVLLFSLFFLCHTPHNALRSFPRSSHEGSCSYFCPI